MSLIALYFLHSTSVLSFHIDVILTLSMWYGPQLVPYQQRNGLYQEFPPELPFLHCKLFIAPYKKAIAEQVFGAHKLWFPAPLLSNGSLREQSVLYICDMINVYLIMYWDMNLCYLAMHIFHSHFVIVQHWIRAWGDQEETPCST